jgi:hypothetical protein
MGLVLHISMASRRTFSAGDAHCARRFLMDEVFLLLFVHKKKILS